MSVRRTAAQHFPACAGFVVACCDIARGVATGVSGISVYIPPKISLP